MKKAQLLRLLLLWALVAWLCPAMWFVPGVAMVLQCCCPGVCGACCTPTHTGSYQIVITSMANGTCSDCASLNQTFTIAKINDCVWSGVAPFLATFCTESLLQNVASLTYSCSIVDGVPQYRARVVRQIRTLPGIGNADWNWDEYFTDSPNCSTVSGLALSNVFSSAHCDGSSSVATISAI